MSTELERIKLWWFNIPLLTRGLLILLTLLFFLGPLRPFDYCLSGSGADLLRLHTLSAFFLSSHLHATFFHLFFNALSLISTAASIEVRLGSGAFACLWIALVSSSNLLFLAVEALFQISVAPWYGWVHPSCVIGSSGAIFGLMMVDALQSGAAESEGDGGAGGADGSGGMLSLWGVVPLRSRWMPVVGIFLLVTLLFPHASVVMHLSGMVAGALLWCAVPGTLWHAASVAASRWLGRWRHHEEGSGDYNSGGGSRNAASRWGWPSSTSSAETQNSAATCGSNSVVVPFSGVGRRLGGTESGLSSS